MKPLATTHLLFQLRVFLILSPVFIIALFSFIISCIICMCVCVCMHTHTHMHCF